MRKWSGTLAGSVIALGLAAGLPIALGSLPPPVDLTVDLSTPRPYVLLQTSRTSIPDASVGPPSIAGRVDVRERPDGLAPGLHLRTWHIDYGHRWEREVTLPFLVGPFDREGTDVCGLSIRLGAGLFDTSKAGAGIKTIVHRVIAQQFPFHIEEQGIELTLPEVQETTFRVLLGRGRADVLIGIRLVNNTTFLAIVPLSLVSRDGSPRLERTGTVQASWNGASRDELLKKAAEKGADAGGSLGALFGLVFGPVGALVGAGVGSDIGAGEGREKANREADERVQQEITGRVDKALEQFAFGMERLREPWSPLSRRPRDQVRLRLARDPIVAPDGITLRLCASITLAEPKVDAAVPGSAAVVSPSAGELGAPEGGDGAVIQILADANAINQILYLLWQSGTLRELGRSSAVLDALPEQLRNLAFDVTGFDPGLPPTVTLGNLGTPQRAGLSILLGDVALGTWGDRRVVGHASTVVGVHEVGDAVELSALLHDINVNCVATGADASTSLTPCLSDLLPTVREMLSEKPLVLRLAGGELFGRFPELTFHGMKLDVSNLRASATSGPPLVNVLVNARILAQP